MLCVPPRYHNKKYMTDFDEEADIFNQSFARQCTLVDSSSILRIDSLRTFSPLSHSAKIILQNL